MNSIEIKLREDFIKIFLKAIEAVDPYRAMLESIELHGELIHIADTTNRSIHLNEFEHIYVIGAGKATAPMAEALEHKLGEKITTGIIIVKDGHTGNLSKIVQYEASHPLPDFRGVRATAEIIDLLAKAKENDLIIAIFSGGASSLFVQPADISLDDKIATTKLLLHAGATIHEINCIRKHLSKVKGGLLAKIAYPATVLNFLISDVIGDDPSTIASGPFVADDTTFADALDILQKYNLINKVPLSVITRLKEGAQGNIAETPKPHDPILQNITTHIVASNIKALKAAQKKAKELGYNTIILSSQIDGDAHHAAKFHGTIAREIHASGNPVPRPACIISGGETTVEVRGKGLGGRNMEFALYAAREIAGIPNMIIASVGTDGTDGPTDAAGAIVNGYTLERANKLGLDVDEYARNNDSYHLFEMLGDLIKTGPTKTNVMDFRIILAL